MWIEDFQDFVSKYVDQDSRFKVHGWSEDWCRKVFSFDSVVLL